MPFAKNDPNINRAGRPTGTPNKTSEQIRRQLKEFIENNLDGLQEEFTKLKPAERFRVLDSLLSYVLPPPISIDRLSEEQMQELFEQLKIKYDEQATDISPN
jgi:hypothetical protein